MLLTLLALAPTFAAPAPLAAPAPQQGAATPGNIFEVAANNGNFTTLVAAIQATGLESALDGSQSDARLTVFAPTDAAFALLPTGTVPALLADLPLLTDILLYHVTTGGLLEANVLATPSIDMLNGQRTDISLQGGLPFIDNSFISLTNIVTSNGVIHVIDAVLMPATDSIVTTAVGAPDANYLTHLLGFLPNLIQTVEAGEFTVFAPTNAAFQQFNAQTLRSLVDPTGLATLESILTVHVVPGRLYADEVVAAGQLTTVGGKVLPVTVQGGNVFVDGSLVVLPNIETSNGNIHFIDTVILP